MDKNKSFSENLREVLKHVVCRDTSDAAEQKKVGYLDALVRFLQQKENEDFKEVLLTGTMRQFTTMHYRFIGQQRSN